jgi:glycosyltransferase involved in cell wall biosynthesis
MEKERQPVTTIAVVTVCKNAGRSLLRTVESVQSQRSKPEQYIIIDSVSTDGSIEQTLAMNVDGLVLLKEADSGIYDAMNKALALCRCDYIYFLNAGDLFVDENVLGDIRLALVVKPVALLYGDVIYDVDGHRFQRRFWHINRYTLPVSDICHQASFVATSVIRDLGGFSNKFRFASDFDLFMKIIQTGAPSKYLERNVALYDGKGFTARHAALVELEKRQISEAWFSNYYIVMASLVFRILRKLFGVGGSQLVRQ